MLNSVGLVPLWVSCSCAFVGPKFFLVGISRVQNFFLVGISRVPKFFSWVFYGSKTYCRRGYFIGSKCFLVGILRIRNFISLVFRGSNIFSSGYFVDPRFFSHGYFEFMEFFLVTSLF